MPKTDWSRLGAGFLVGALGFACAATSGAEIVTRPAGLNPGRQYRLAFITLDRTTALSPDIAFYNSFVTAQANTAPDLVALGTSWHAIGSTASVTAKQNTDTDDSTAGASGVPVYRLDGAIVANSYDDLWDGSIQNPLYVAQDGTVLDTCCGTWTGTNRAGTAAAGYELGSPTLQVVDGAPNGVGSNWVETSPFGAGSPQFLYAISDILTVAPEIIVQGGAVQECASHGGNRVQLSVTPLDLPAGDKVVSIEWLLDSQSIGSGETYTAFVPLGSHTVEAILTTLFGTVFRTDAFAEVVDTAPPKLSLSLSGLPGQLMQVHLSATDVCDPSPTTEAVAGVPLGDGDVFKVRSTKGDITIETRTATVRATSIDASGNFAQTDKPL